LRLVFSSFGGVPGGGLRGELPWGRRSPSQAGPLLAPLEELVDSLGAGCSLDREVAPLELLGGCHCRYWEAWGHPHTFPEVGLLGPLLRG
jgi:hypothetical protein